MNLDCVHTCSVTSVVSDFAAIWTIALQAPAHGLLQARILRGLSFPPPRGHPDPGTASISLALQAASLPTEPPGKP